MSKSRTTVPGVVTGSERRGSRSGLTFSPQGARIAVMLRNNLLSTTYVEQSIYSILWKKEVLWQVYTLVREPIYTKSDFQGWHPLIHPHPFHLFNQATRTLKPREVEWRSSITQLVKSAEMEPKFLNSKPGYLSLMLHLHFKRNS